MAEEDYPKLDINVDTTLKDLDFDQIRQERFDRNRHFLESVNPIVAAKVFPGHEYEGRQVSKAAQAAITIQRYWRGYKGREVYISALWEQFEKEEEKQHEKMKYQIEEGELLVENRQLEVLLDDGKTTRRNAERRYLSKVITIQRAWRSYLEKPASERSNRETRYQGDHHGKLTSNTGKINRLNPFDNCSDYEGENIDSESFMFNPLIGNEKSSLNSDNKSPLVNNFFKSAPSKNKEDNLNISVLSPRQQRKHSLLSKAHEFAELKKLDSKVLPFDLHLHIAEGESSESQSAATKGSNMSTNMPPSVNSDQNRVTSPDEYIQKDLKEATKDYSETKSKGDNCVEEVNKHNVKKGIPSVDTNSGADNLLSCDKDNNSGSQNVCDTNGDNYNENNVNCDNKGDNSYHTIDKQESDSDAKGSNSGKKDIVESAFDVYNIETTLPDMDWSSLEQKLKAASEEARLIQEARRNDREEIRKKLAMGGEDGFDDDDDDDDEVTYKKPNIQSRLQSGLQICFMNESPGDTDNEGISPRQHEIHDNVKLMKKVSSLVDSDNNLSTVADLNNPTLPTTSIQSSSPPRLKPDDDLEKSEDFHSRQEQLQNEAKMALAQAGSMAHMQLEIEKQLKKKSPMAEMVGIPGLGEKHRKKLGLRQLQQMNLASIQVLYNDLQTQIESLNEELVHLLMERDELHMAQDSMLVDIEDLTRRAEELAERANRTGGNKGNKTTSVKGKLPAR